MLRLALNGALFYLSYSLLYDFRRADLAYPLMIGTLGALTWSTRTERIQDLFRLCIATGLIGTVTLILGQAMGKDMLLGGYIILCGATPYLCHRFLFKRSGGRSNHSR